MLVNRRNGAVLAQRITLCDTFWKRGLGVMFRRELKDDEVYLFVEKRESITLTAIHMLFVFFPLAVFWLDNERVVVDAVLAKPFRPHYAPSRPARYFIEGQPILAGRNPRGGCPGLGCRLSCAIMKAWKAGEYSWYWT